MYIASYPGHCDDSVRVFQTGQRIPCNMLLTIMLQTIT